VTSASDCVENSTLPFLRRKVFEPFAQLGAKNGIVEREPRLVDREQSRPAVEVGLDAMEQIGQDGTRRRLRASRSSSRTPRHRRCQGLALGVEQPAPRGRRSCRAPGGLEPGIWISAVNPVIVRSPLGAEARSRAPPQIADRNLGGDLDPLGRKQHGDPVGRPGALADHRSRQGLEGDRAVVGQIVEHAAMPNTAAFEDRPLSNSTIRAPG